jgi:predicted metal-binding membrane protein
VTTTKLDGGRGRRAVAGIPVVAAAAIVGAWTLAITAQTTGMDGRVHHDALLEGGPPLGLALLVFLLAWQLMIAAMMLPSSLPLVRIFAAASAGQPRPGTAMAGLLAGYALVWSAFGVLAFLFDLGAHAAIESSSWLHHHEWLLGVSVLALAGAFQFTKLKYACLDRCRNPGQFLIRFYERGGIGGLRFGARHGVYCVGCCWALMLVMFAVGIANLAWMAALTALMVHEKTRPLGGRAVPVTGMALLGAASILLLYSAGTA